MGCLHRAFDGKAIISSVASVGFHTQDSDLHKHYRTFTLQEQCAHKAAYLQQHVFPSHDLPVVVMGHSIGIYMAMQAVRQCESESNAERQQNGSSSGAGANGSAEVPDLQSETNR